MVRLFENRSRGRYARRSTHRTAGRVVTGRRCHSGLFASPVSILYYRFEKSRVSVNNVPRKGLVEDCN